MAANYYCSDTVCSARIKIIYDLEVDDNGQVIKEIKFRKELNKSYEYHSYYRLDIIKKDMHYKSKNDIKKKLSDYKYRYLVLKEISYSNPTKFGKPRDLEEYFFMNMVILK